MKNMKKIVKIIRKQVIKEFKSIPGKAWVVNKHLLVVEKWVKKLCKLYPQADQEVVLLSVWFHDIGRSRRHQQ